MRTAQLIALLFTAACVETLDLEQSTSAITQSPETSAHPAVVDITITVGGNSQGCTGSVLSAHWILTAAHCVYGVPDGSDVMVHNGQTRFYNSTGTFIPYEYFNPPLDANDDIGLIRLHGDGINGIAQQAGVWGGPIHSGDIVNVIGFGDGSDPGGTEYCTEGNSGTKRIQDYALTYVASEHLMLDHGTAKICPGDSGGPWFRPFGDRLLVSAVTAFGDGPLNDVFAPRVDEKLDWIAGKLAPSAVCPRFPSISSTYWECFESAQRARDVATGGRHACAALMDGRVKCWGDNTSGKLGNDSTNDSMLPVTAQLSAATPGPVTRVAAGANHTCAMTSGGLVSCWGSNSHGQLGDATLTGEAYRTGQAVRRADGTLLSNVRDVSAGTLHTCAVTWDERVYCWGDNTYGQLGNDQTASSASPTLVGEYDELEPDPGSKFAALGFPIPQPFTPLADIQQLDVGHRHACAIDSTGAAYCWGYNAWGQLGNNTTSTSRKPVKLTLTNVFRISAGYGHTCATHGTAADRAACWGFNGLGQLGLGHQTNRLVPTNVVVGLGGSLEVTAGQYHTCFTGSDRQKCAGDNARGQLGGPAAQMYLSLVESAIEADTTTPHAGDQFTCTLLDNGTVACSGANTDGQLAAGTANDRSVFSNARDLHHLPGAL